MIRHARAFCELSLRLFSFNHDDKILNYCFVTGHLTQVLWKNTTQMGTACASSVLPNNQVLVFVVANYWPGGNWNKEEYYFQNVLPYAYGFKIFFVIL